MRRARVIAATVLVVLLCVSGVAAYWEWLRPMPQSVSCGYESAGGLGPPPTVFILKSPAFWTQWQGPSGYVYNLTFTYLVATASTNWTGIDLINESMHSAIEYTVTLLNHTFGAREVFTSSHSSWRFGSGPGSSQQLTNWTPASGAHIGVADVLQFMSRSNLTAPGLEVQLEMAATSCGPWDEQLIVV
jgi:hypothetical protein